MENKEYIQKSFIKWIKDRNDINYEKFYNSAKQLVYKVAFSYLKNQEDCDDLVQDVFIKIYNLKNDKLPSYNELSWLYSITKNSSINFIKSRKPELPTDEVFEIQDTRDELEQIIDRDRFNNLIYNLPYKEKEIITLKILGEFSFKEIAGLLDMKIANVKWYYYKSIKTLRLALGNMAMCIITFTLYLKARKTEIDKSQNAEEIEVNKNSNVTNTNNDKNNYVTNENSNTAKENNNFLDSSLDIDVSSNSQTNQKMDNTISSTTTSSNDNVGFNITPSISRETSWSFLIATIVFLIGAIIFSTLFLKSQKINKKTN